MQPAVAVFSWCKVNNHFPITASRRRLFPAGAARRRHSPGGPAAVGAPAACARPALRPWGGGRFGLPYRPFGPAERAVSARRMARFATRCLSGPCAACPRPLPVAGRAPCRPRPFSHVFLMNARKLPGCYMRPESARKMVAKIQSTPARSVVSVNFEQLLTPILYISVIIVCCVRPSKPSAPSPPWPPCLCLARGFAPARALLPGRGPWPACAAVARARFARPSACSRFVPPSFAKQWRQACRHAAVGGGWRPVGAAKLVLSIHFLP